MKYIDEYRRQGPIRRAADTLRRIAPPYPVAIMEVCGTHTQQFYRFGLDELLPPQVRLIAGPGCPVCVSTQEYIDRAIAYAGMPGATVLTFGDMVRVPGTRSSLERERARGARVVVVYSPLDALAFASAHPDRNVVFLAVGFETTAAPIAVAILEAQKRMIKNLYFYSGLKTIPAVMHRMVRSKAVSIDGFLCPGHVSAIIGTRPYQRLAREAGISCCVAGFEPLDILQGLTLLLRRIRHKRTGVDNQYSRVVTESGNARAQNAIRAVFIPYDAAWRGLGTVPASGLAIRKRFAHLDAERALRLRIERTAAPRKAALCRCAQVIMGVATPDSCALFRKRCSPEHPYGPCMVSSEGACNAYYRYRRRVS